MRVVTLAEFRAFQSATYNHHAGAKAAAWRRRFGSSTELSPEANQWRRSMGLS